MTATAAAMGPDSPWTYLVVFLGVFAGWAGVPAIGGAAVGAAAVAASQGRLEIVPVLVVSVVAGAVGGLVGYYVGHRWGRQFLQRPGKRQAKRVEALAKAEQVYARWGRLAVFFTPGWVTGTAGMPFRSFAVWNFFASIVFTLSTGPAAYGAGQVSSGRQDAVSLSSLIFGLAIGAGCLQLARRYRAARRAHRAAAGSRDP